jgi:hypothetical protein
MQDLRRALRLASEAKQSRNVIAAGNSGLPRLLRRLDDVVRKCCYVSEIDFFLKINYD